MGPRRCSGENLSPVCMATLDSSFESHSLVTELGRRFDECHHGTYGSFELSPYRLTFQTPHVAQPSRSIFSLQTMSVVRLPSDMYSSIVYSIETPDIVA